MKCPLCNQEIQLHDDDTPPITLDEIRIAQYLKAHANEYSNTTGYGAIQRLIIQLENREI